MIFIDYADVAQLAEQGFRKAQVGGSNPLIGSEFSYGPRKRTLKR